MRSHFLTIKRRSFLRGGAAVAAATALPLVFSYHRTARADYGALVPDPQGLFDLPAGFTYTIVDQGGDMMSDGYVVPGAPDAMGVFQGPNNTIILMRNHELTSSDGPYTNGQDPPPEAYDPNAVGGVTRVVLDNDTLAVASRNLVLVGTIRNCAGGVSPWGWLSCEENMNANHGYTFLCPIDADTVAMPRKITGYGRCNHEAACVDPDTFYAYLTEDRGDSCLYRFVPADKADPFTGKLQALKVIDQNKFATTTMDVSEIVDCEWVDIDEPDPAGDTLRVEAQAKGAAIFVRGEGIWFFEGAIYVCATTGGPAAGGQIFRLIDVPGSTKLELIGRSDDKDLLDMPDNICVAPWGEIFMAEDGGGDNFVRVLTPTGEVFDFGRTDTGQLAGVCFSPDGKTLFVNLQDVDTTIAVRGPFPMVEDPDTTGGDSETSGGTSDAGTGSSTDGTSDGVTGGSTSDGTTGTSDGTTGGSTGNDSTTTPGTASASGGDTSDPTTSGAPSTAGGTTGGTADGSTSDSATGGMSDDDSGCGCDTQSSNPTLDLALAAAGVAVLRSVTRAPAPVARPNDESAEESPQR